jgi:phosphatidylserine/phosphatidylglycerophosphate/cardiolipin synthase-like enzyme
VDLSAWDAILRTTADDAKLSSGERKAVRERLRDAALDDRVRSLLRSRAYELARERVGDPRLGDILGWLEEVNKLLLPTSLEGEPEFTEAHFSPGEACVRRITGLLEGCRRGADLCVYTITDDRIATAILAAHRRGAAVRIVTDNEKAYDAGSDAIGLARAGVPVRVDVSTYHMHHKFAVFDGAVVLTGSYNWTRGAAENNEENLIVSNDRRLLEAFRREFERLWEKFSGSPLG